MPNGISNSVNVPRWVVVVVGFLLATSITSMVAWAVNIDVTQRNILIDVSELKEHKIHVTEQLDRIESKLDQLLVG